MQERQADNQRRRSPNGKTLSCCVLILVDLHTKKIFSSSKFDFLCFINFSSPSKLSELQIRISHAQPDAGEIEAVQKEMEINARAIRHVIKIAIFTFAGLERNALTISGRRNLRLTSRWESRDERKSIERLITVKHSTADPTLKRFFCYLCVAHS